MERSSLSVGLGIFCCRCGCPPCSFWETRYHTCTDDSAVKAPEDLNEPRTMTDRPKRPTLELPAEIIAELHAANAKHVADCDGFNGGEFQLWATARGPLLVLLTPDDDAAVFFRPLGSSPSRSPRNLGRILREQDNEPDNPAVENSSLESNNVDPDRRKIWEQFEERVKHIYSILLNLKGEKVSVSRDVKLIGRDGLIHQFDVYYEFSRAGGIIRLTYQHTRCRNDPHCERDNQTGLSTTKLRSLLR